ncbi:MAG TPA: DUF4350 domain-containing protein [Polyangiaceae bacterium]|nr:DUF4350 domain-containing protein [Polyangiaceae bacterium]
MGVFLTCLGLAWPAAAAFEVNDTDWEGTSELLDLARAELGRARVEIVGTLEYGKLDAADGVLVLHPTVDLDADEMDAFLAAGGRLALLDDRGRATSYLSRYRIQRVEAPQRPAQTLRGNPSLPIAVPVLQEVAGQEQSRHPTMRDVERIVTNHPTALTHQKLTPVLEIPAVGEPNATLALTGVIKRGRVFAMGDPSTVINLMLRYPGNRAFARHLVQYLVERDERSEHPGKLYIVTNAFAQRGHFGGERGPLREVADAVMSLRDALRTAGEAGLPGTFAIVLAAAALAVALAWSLEHALRAYRRYVPRYALAEPLALKGGVAGRAALLAAQATDRALVMAELRSALAEALTERLGTDPRAVSTRLLEEVKAKGVLGPSAIGELGGLLSELDRGIAVLGSGRKLRIAESRVLELYEKMMAILREIDERKQANG